MFGQSISGQIDADNNGYAGEYKIYLILYIGIHILWMLLYREVHRWHGRILIY